MQTPYALKDGGERSVLDFRRSVCLYGFGRGTGIEGP